MNLSPGKGKPLFYLFFLFFSLSFQEKIGDYRQLLLPIYTFHIELRLEQINWKTFKLLMLSDNVSILVFSGFSYVRVGMPMQRIVGCVRSHLFLLKSVRYWQKRVTDRDIKDHNIIIRFHEDMQCSLHFHTIAVYVYLRGKIQRLNVVMYTTKKSHFQKQRCGVIFCLSVFIS